MRTFILIIAILGLATCFEVNATSNQLDSCLKQVKATSHGAFSALQDGLSKNWIDTVKFLFETGAEGVQSYEDCKAVESKDLQDWITGNTSTQTQTCLGMAVMTFDSFKLAIHDKSLKAMVQAVSCLDVFSQTCMLE